MSGAIDYFREIVTTDKRISELSSFSGTVIGVYCNFVPEALIYAVGALPVRMCSGSRDAARQGEEVFPRDVCSLVKACVGEALQDDPLFARLDAVVIPTSCDAKTKLGALLEQYKPVHIMQLPRSKDTRGAAKFWLGEVREFITYLERMTGRTLTLEALEQAIALMNKREQVFRRFLELRQRVPSPITGEEALLVTGASFTDDVARFTSHLEQLCVERETMDPPHPRKIRLLLTGAPLIYPHTKLLHIIDAIGAEIAIDEMCSGTPRLYDPIVCRDRSVRALIESVAEKHLLPSTCPCFAQHTDRFIRIQELVDSYHLDGILYHNLRVCPSFDIESMAMQRECKRWGIPFLAITTDYNQDDTEQILTRVAAFIEMLGVRAATAV